MNTKEADNFIRHECLSYQLPKDRQNFDKKKGEVLDFIGELGNYKLMWEEFYRIYGKDLMNLESYLWDRTKYGSTWVGINERMNELEQKYFPEPFKKTITIEIKAKNEIDMKWFLDRFKSFKEQIMVDLPYTKIETKESD